jgi:hypothetical protein
MAYHSIVLLTDAQLDDFADTAAGRISQSFDEDFLETELGFQTLIDICVEEAHMAFPGADTSALRTQFEAVLN